MSTLSDIVGGAKNSVKTTLPNTKNSILTDLGKGNISNAIDTALNFPNDVGNTLASGGSAPFGDAFGGMAARKDALQNWCWYCMPPAVSNSSALAIMSFAPSVSLPWYYVVGADLPQRSFDVKTYARNGTQVSNPSGCKVDNLTLKLFADSSSKAIEWVSAWQSLVMENRNPKTPANQGLWGLPANYKKDISFFLLSVDQKQLVEIIYSGCWPVSEEAYSLVSGTSEVLGLSLTLSVDNVYRKISNDKGLIDNLKDTALGYGMSALSGATSAAMSGISSGISNIF
jgi:hypothetical protein